MTETISQRQLAALLQMHGLEARPQGQLDAFWNVASEHTRLAVADAFARLQETIPYIMPAHLNVELGGLATCEDAWANVLPLVEGGILSSNPHLYDQLNDIEDRVLRNCGYKIRTAKSGTDRLIFKQEYEAEMSRRDQERRKRREELESGNNRGELEA